MDYFTADHHFGHTNVIKFCNRPFSSVEEMDDKLIQYWNEKVTKKDNVFILGDFFWKANVEYCKNILEQLNGHKYMIIGSHDHFIKKIELQKYFVFVKKYHVYKKENIRAVLFHNPLFSWDGMDHGVYHFFGHVHNKYICINGNTMAYNVGVDVNNFTPVSLNEIFNKLNNLII
ncbi:hydrolase [Candidatus Dojkabacteria bacterium]|jgi:calcineurin-like phosphoesterase family protein|nr:hydrolase [Candidatus Dojkabacteria bacterium]